MKKLSYLIILTVILGLVLTGCTLLSNIGQTPTSEQSGITYLTKGGPTENEADEYTLYAGQDIPVGTVNVWNDSEKLYVRYVVDDPWEMTGSHLYVGKADPDGFPSTPGQLPYSPGMKKSPSPNASYDDTTMTYTIPLAEIYEYEFVGKGQGKGLNAIGTPGVEPCNEIYIAAQAEVFRSYELVNPGAEDGMNGWDIIGPVGAVASRGESTGTVLPRSDMYFFDMTTPPAAHAKMSQGVSVAGFDGTSFNANCWIQTELYPDPDNTNITDNDYGELVLTFKNEFDVELESFTTGPIGNPVFGTGFDGYAQFSLTGNIPDGAVTAIYKLDGFLVQGGAVNVFYDDLSFEYWQEETAWADGDSQFFGKNWATYFTYHIAGVLPTISSEDLAGPYNKDEDREFSVKTVNPECGFEYPRVIFNYIIENITLSEITSFEYYDEDTTTWYKAPKIQDGPNVIGFFGPPTGFPMDAPYDETTTFRINIGIVGTFPVTITLNDLVDVAVLATLTEDVVVFPETLLAIGVSYGGGIVAYILQSEDPGYIPGEQHGLIAAITDQITGIQWYNESFVATGATGTAIGTGQANTTTIVTIQGAGSYAAQLCNDLTVGAYNDWFLPSKDELNKLFMNQFAIGGFAYGLYWSSSEGTAYLAWVQNFSNGNQHYYYKSNSSRVRAIRVF